MPTLRRGSPLSTIVCVESICDIPTKWWGDAETNEEHAQVAVRHLMSALSDLRGVQYELVDYPDVIERQQRAPDFRYVCPNTGDITVVEYKRFVDPDDWEAAAHLRAGKRFRAKGAVRPLEHHGEQFGTVSVGDPRQELRTLRNFMIDMIRRGQLQACEADERILLVLDARRIFLEFVSDGDFSFSEAERDTVDHAFLLRPGAGGVTPSPSQIMQIW